MTINVEKIKQLLDSDVTGYQISKSTGIQEIQISKLRNNKIKLENITLETASKLMEFIKERGMIYLVIDSRENDEFIEDFESLEKANEHAKRMWDHLTKKEQEKARIYVLGLEKENYELIQNGETEKWYGDFADESLDTFDSENL